MLRRSVGSRPRSSSIGVRLKRQSSFLPEASIPDSPRCLQLLHQAIDTPNGFLRAWRRIIIAVIIAELDVCGVVQYRHHPLDNTTEANAKPIQAAGRPSGISIFSYEYLCPALPSFSITRTH